MKTTVRFHFTPVSWAIIRKAESNKCWWGYAWLEGMQNGASTVENGMVIP